MAVFEDAYTLWTERRLTQSEAAHRRRREPAAAANVRLRDYLAAMPEAVLHYPPLPLCTDNGAMIAYAGWRRLAAGQSEPLAIHTRPRWPLSELPTTPGPGVMP